MMRPFRLLSAALAGIVLSAVLVSPAHATISGSTATNTATTVTYRFSYTGSPQYLRVYVDTDRNAGTGFAQGGTGADYLLENGSLYQHTGSGWSWTLVSAVTFSGTGGVAQWTVNRADLGESASPNDADLIFQVEAPLESSSKYTHVYSGGGSGGTVTYTAATDNFANPERGFYHHTGDCDKADFSQTTLQSYRTSQGISLVMCVFYLAEYKNGPIAQAALDQLQQQIDTVRAAGLKMVLRFAYTTSTAGDDTTKDRILAHLDQLAPYLNAGKDVIAVVQAGLIGAWGEWYYTQNFGNAGTITHDRLGQPQGGDRQAAQCRAVDPDGAAADAEVQADPVLDHAGSVGRGVQRLGAVQARSPQRLLPGQPGRLRHLREHRGRIPVPSVRHDVRRDGRRDVWLQPTAVQLPDGHQ